MCFISVSTLMFQLVHVIHYLLYPNMLLTQCNLLRLSGCGPTDVCISNDWRIMPSSSVQELLDKLNASIQVHLINLLSY